MLRERFRALDALEVPDVLSRARSIGPRPPDPEPTPRMQRVGAYVLAAVIATLAVIAIARALDKPERPADDPTPTPIKTETVQRRDGEILRYTGNLVAVDPQTGEAPVVVDGRRLPGRIGNAAWSADGRWLAFDIRGCTPNDPNAGLWVSDALGDERRLTDRPCATGGVAVPADGVWAWSPTTAQLAVERGSADGDSLILIDAATGDVADLGPVEGDLNTLAWSPDGTRITYNTDPSGSIYSVSVEDGTTSLLADRLGYVYGIGESGIHWSPDGAHVAIAVNHPAPAGPYRLYLMDADGSGLRAIDDHVQDVEWSPDGTRIAFATFTGSRQERLLWIWTVSLEDPAPFLVYEEPSFTTYETADPVWSPDGRLIAFTTVTADDEIVHMVISADGAGDAREIDELRHLSWRGGWYFCECYG